MISRVSKYLTLIILILTTMTGMAQTTLTIEECYARAEQNYPLIKQRALIERSTEYALTNISKGSFPQVGIFGQATYQSEVTEVPISLPGVEIPTPPKDQFRLYGEVTQPLTDIALIRQQKEVQRISSAIQEQSLETELYKIRERVNQLFFGTLLIDEQLKQNALLKKDIETGIARVTASVNFGTELRSNVDKLRAELLKVEQRSIELQSSRQAWLEMLGLFMGQPIDAQTELAKPAGIEVAGEISRPELALYDLQRRSYDAQRKLVNIRNAPKFSLFFQGGIGQPSPLNMLTNELSPYYMGGIRLTWLLTGFYTSGKEKQLLVLNQEMTQVQRETFMFNTTIALRQQNADITKLQELIRTDDEIIELRTSVKEASSAQLENGVITVNDFLREVNAEDQARQNKLLHEVQLLMAQYNYQTTAGW